MKYEKMMVLLVPGFTYHVNNIIGNGAHRMRWYFENNAAILDA